MTEPSGEMARPGDGIAAVDEGIAQAPTSQSGLHDLVLSSLVAGIGPPPWNVSRKFAMSIDLMIVLPCASSRPGRASRHRASNLTTNELGGIDSGGRGTKRTSRRGRAARDAFGQDQRPDRSGLPTRSASEMVGLVVLRRCRIAGELTVELGSPPRPGPATRTGRRR
jgi:hypothetical protein